MPRNRLAGRVADAFATGGLLVTAGAGYGKTTLLEQALAESSIPVAWIGCTETERAPEVLLNRILAAVGRAAPGASEGLTERLEFAPEQLDALAATRELLTELHRLLVDPIGLVIDDAENLEGAEGSLALISEMFRAEIPSLHLALASRHSLELRVAKPRATGHLAEITAADLAFNPEECDALLRLQGTDNPSQAEVEAIMEATQGWPLGITVAVRALATMRREGDPIDLRGLRSAPEARAFLTEELLDSLEPELRERALEASVTRVVTAEVTAALGLPTDLGRRLELAGMLVRRLDEDEAFSYHPLLRELLLERLCEERGEEEQRRLHGAVAQAIAAAGDTLEAIEHWLKARAWTEAVSAIEREGPVLVRTSAGLVRRWLSLLPPGYRALPTIRSLEGQLEWGAGDHPKATELLRDAIRGFRDRPNPPAEWMARFVLADSLFGVGEFEQTLDLVEGWDEPAARAAGALAPATAIYAAVNLAAIGRFEESDRLAARVRGHSNAGLVSPIEAIRRAFHDTPRGDLAQVYARLEAAAAELEASDPFNRRLYLLASLAIQLADFGRPDAALEMWMRVRDGARGGAGPFLVDTTHAWCAVLHAQEGRLLEAEVELLRYEGREKGWRTHIGNLAAACVASLRGDVDGAIARGEAALAMVARGPILFRYWAAADLVPALAAVGRPDRAGEVLADTLDVIDRVYPGPLGRFPRARLLALRAWLRDTAGDSAEADRDLRRFWEEAEETLPYTLRREWARLEQPVWGALERGTLEPETAVAAIAGAFPEGLPLVAFLGHPVAAVRRAALAPAAESGDPAVIGHLQRVADDPDPQQAETASRAIERVARILPPLRFELLGGFAAGRGSWRVGDAWSRPVDARLVRFLLVHLGESVSEDQIFAALWPDLLMPSARRSLHVAASRVRRLLDRPGIGHSVIESVERRYRLALDASAVVDAEEFRSAAAAGLADQGEQRRHLLERARSLWGGEPLPEERYADWATPYRERLIDSYKAVLAALIEICERAGGHTDVAEVARELVDLDPLDEGGHRALIKAYARAGRTGQALRQYLECRRALVGELGVEPAEATSSLQGRILAGQPV